MQKPWTVLKTLEFLVFEENWICIIYAKVMTSHLSNPYIVTHKNVNTAEVSLLWTQNFVELQIITINIF